jgi:hypothetical protein
MKVVLFNDQDNIRRETVVTVVYENGELQIEYSNGQVEMIKDERGFRVDI